MKLEDSDGISLLQQKTGAALWESELRTMKPPSQHRPALSLLLLLWFFPLTNPYLLPAPLGSQALSDARRQSMLLLRTVRRPQAAIIKTPRWSSFSSSAAAGAWWPDRGTRSRVRSLATMSHGGQREQPNRLIDAKSPYLLHHAYNPVDWYPWGEEAFNKAREENKPIFCSVGYSSCHWCLVMARESFESTDIAHILNDKFVCVKVDREERPDIDAMLIQFLEQATGGAGWPMSVFLTPTGLKPFTGGTYFPPERFASILERVAEAWQKNRDEVEAQGDRVVQVFRQQLASAGAGSSSSEAEVRVSELVEAVRAAALAHLSQDFDSTHGGFGKSLKFPRPSVINFLFRSYYLDPRRGEALHMGLTTLLKMAQGGIRDHIGGGFHRYSTDRRWHVPHFEKMLNDNAQLITSYVEAFLITGDPVLEEVARDTIHYLTTDMMTASQDGSSVGFFSAESAESPPPAAREGAFYVWTKEEVVEALGQADAEHWCALLGVKEGGNVPPHEDPHGELEGQNVLFLTKPLAELSSDDKRVLEAGRQALTRARASRPRPERDEKVVVSWNAQLMSALAKASTALHEPAYLRLARGIATHIRTTLFDEQTAALRRLSFQGVASEVPAMADDYGFLVRGLIDLYEATGDADLLRWAKRLQVEMDRLFLCGGGPEGEGYLSVRRDDPSIAYLVKSTYDGAEPSVTSVAVHNLLRLAALTDDDKMYKQAERILASVLQDPSAPYAAPELLSAVLYYGDSLREIIITGTPGAQDTQALLDVVHGRFLPDSIVIRRGPSADDPEALSLFSPTVRMCGLVQGMAAARTCQARVCSPPVIEADTLRERLAAPPRKRPGAQ